MPKKILLTGGHGFIGKNIIEQLGNKYEFLVPTHQELDLTDAEDVLNYLKEAKVDWVIHGANIGGNRKELGLRGVAFSNLQMFFNIVKAKKYFNRLIVLGSGAEYGKHLPIAMVKESDFDKEAPRDEYGFAKYVMAKYAGQVDYITHLRIFGIYGKYEDYQTRFISNSICKVLFDLPITMKQNVFFDYLYINDFVSIVDKFLAKPAKEIYYNIGNGQRVDLLTIAKLILKVTGKNLPIQIAQAGLNNEYTCNTDRLKEEFPDIKYTAIEEAIGNLTKHYEQMLLTLDKQLFLYDI